MAGGYGDRTLKETPTWAVAVVSAGFIIISILIEHGIHSLSKMFQKRQKKAMSEALQKIKDELMLLGFMSLLITVTTKPISRICISNKAGNVMLPCKKEKYVAAIKIGGSIRRLMSSYAEEVISRRVLASAAGGADYCTKKNQVPLISYSGLHQLHVFLFVLAVFHVLYSVITIGLAQAKMKKWKTWERETNFTEFEVTNDPSRFRFTHQTSFIQRHTGLETTSGIRWIVAFFRQFFTSVTKVDYLTLRHGFINAHFAPNSKFDFHRYIKRSMEDDFKVVVSISIPLWTFAVIFQLLNVYKWYTLSWISVAPLVMLLIIGAKLEVIIMDMAKEIRERATIVLGAPIVEASNKYFWFNRPGLILALIHFTLFQNAFQMAYFLWTWYEFGLKSCFHEGLALIILRVGLSVALQVVCSYVTFPLYCFVTQMGSHMKASIFEEHTARALKNWQKNAKEHKVKNLKKGDASSSPSHLLHNYNTRSTDVESATSTPNYNSETELAEIEGIPSPVDHDFELTTNNTSATQRLNSKKGDQFSFRKF